MIPTPRFLCVCISLIISFTSLAMHKQKQLASQTITLGEVGGIQSLCTATKGTSEICIIGHTRCEAFEVGHLSTADQTVKDLLRPLLEQWSRFDKGITFLIFDSATTCSKHERILHVPHRDITFYLPLRAALNAFAAQNNYKLNNLSMLCTPPLDAFEDYEWNPSFIFGLETFPGLAEQAGFIHKDVGSTDRQLATMTPLARKRFFQRNEPFEAFIQAVQKKFIKDRTDLTKPLMSIKQYSELISYALKQTPKYAKRFSSEHLKKEALALVSLLEQTQQTAQSYYTIYGIDEEGTLVEALLEVIKKKGSINASLEEFTRELLNPIMSFRDLATHAHILRQAETHPRLTFVYPYDSVYNLVTFLNESGYEISYKGQIPKVVQNTRVALNRSPFSPAEITSYLNTRFAMTAPQEVTALTTDSTLPHFDQMPLNPSSLGAMLSEIAQLNISAKSEPSLENPELQFTWEKEEVIAHQCLICNLTFSKGTLHPEQAQICSSSCLVKHEISQKCPELAKLLQKTKASKQDKLIKKQLSALCSLWFLALSPGSGVSDNAFHRLSLDAIFKRLELIEHSKDVSWVKTIEYAKLLGIELSLLKTFVKLHSDQKECYARKLIKHVSLHSKDFAPIFDDEDKLHHAQQELYRLVRTVFRGTENVSELFFTQFYYALAMRLSQELITTQRAFKEILRVAASEKHQGKKGDSIDKALDFINRK